MAQKLLLVRHGETVKAFQGRYIGSTDVPLSRQGCIQAARLRSRLKKEKAAAWYCSPLWRARQTAEKAAGPAGIRVEPDLCEIDFGRWEGLTFAEIQARFPREVKLWARFRADFAFPGGERLRDFIRRVQGLGKRFAAEKKETVVFFTHAGVIRMLICYFLELKPRDYLRFEIKPGSVTTLHLFEGRGTLAGLSEI